MKMQLKIVGKEPNEAYLKYREFINTILPMLIEIKVNFPKEDINLGPILDFSIKYSDEELKFFQGFSTYCESMSIKISDIQDFIYYLKLIPGMKYFDSYIPYFQINLDTVIDFYNEQVQKEENLDNSIKR